MKSLLSQILQKPLVLLLIVTLIKGILYSVIVPPWEFPDEHAHFAQVMYYAESGFDIRSAPLNTSKEIIYSMRALGSERVGLGTNYYTYNPSFKPAYSDSTVGIYEANIRNFTKADRTEYVSKQAALYPPFFYIMSSIGYRFSTTADLFTRVFFTRIISVLITCVAIWVSYRVGLRLFKNKFLAITSATLLSFHPMFSFVSSGINNDNLLNLVGICIVWLCLVFTEDGLKWWSLPVLGVLVGIGLLTKQLIFPVIFGVIIVLVLERLLHKRPITEDIKIYVPLLISSLILFGSTILQFIKSGNIPFVGTPNPASEMKDLTLLSYSISQAKKYYRETLVWYWGVYKWLGVVLPLNLIRGIKVVMVFSGLGLVVHSIRSKSQVVLKRHTVTLIILTVVYIVSLSLWDYLGIRNRGFSHGLQGRYFFPLISAHLSLLLIGILSLVKDKYRQLIAFTSLVGMIVVHSISLLVLTRSYYALTSIRLLLVQMSQYKPYFLKYPFSLVIISMYSMVLILFVYSMVLLKPDKETSGE